jgi:hypothetical protein
MIISSLSRSDILTNAQRVSHTWKNAITQSPTIQRCLGMRPEADRVVSPLDFIHDHMQYPSDAYMLSFPDMPVYPYNTHMNRCTRDSVPGHWWQRWGTTQSHPNHTILWSNFRVDAQASSTGFRPTWLGLFVTEPRITVAFLEVELFKTDDEELQDEEDEKSQDDKDRKCFSCFYRSCASVRDPEGLTFETVLKAAEKIRQSAPIDDGDSERACVKVRFVTEERPGECKHALDAAKRAERR